MSVTSEAAAAEAVESLADTAEDLEIDVEAGESSSSEEEEEEEGGKALEPIAEGRVANPDRYSIGSVDLDPDSGSGSRRAKMTHKSRKKKFKSS